MNTAPAGRNPGAFAPHRRTRGRRPARHRKVAVSGWLPLAVAAFAAGQHLGTDNLNGYDPGQAGVAQRIIARPVVHQPDSEAVLVQGRPARPTATTPRSGRP